MMFPAEIFHALLIDMQQACRSRLVSLGAVESRVQIG